jgi:uncharacterized protein (TIGR03067 family)
MARNLPARPNLDHLRRQAKVLLADLAAGQPAAITLLHAHLPAAQKLSAAEIRAGSFRLADAQAAIARQTGFAGWPHLARHVEQLRALEGTWAFERLEADGQTVPASMLATSRILIDGDRFRTESPEAIYEGIFNLDVEATPHAIDIDFVAGPEAGNTNHGIFRLEGDRLEICLDLNGRPRPLEFRTTAGSGHACELLRRASPSRPPGVDGGTAPAQSAAVPAAEIDRAGFDYVPSPLLTRLQGDWTAEEIVRDGEKLPPFMLRTAQRHAEKNEVKISIGGRVMIHALVKLDDQQQPAAVEYLHVDGMTKGARQHGIFQWEGEVATFCMGMPDGPRPTDFASTAGSGRTVSRWKRK